LAKAQDRDAGGRRRTAAGGTSRGRQIRLATPEVKLPRRRGRAAADELPGEFEALTWHAGRGAVTEQEALGVARRQQRLHAKRRAELITELPAGDETKHISVYRLPPRALMFAKARAEIERTTLTAVLEAFLTEYAFGTPDDPDVVLAHQLELHERMLGRAVIPDAEPRGDRLSTLEKQMERLAGTLEELMRRQGRG
jgi:hypothetical protein